MNSMAKIVHPRLWLLPFIGGALVLALMVLSGPMLESTNRRPVGSALPRRVDPNFAFGLYVQGSSMTELSKAESALGRKADVFLEFASIGGTFNREKAERLVNNGYTVVLTLMFWEGIAPDERYSLSQIAAGELDDDIDRWANELRSFGMPIVLRPLHEFNNSTYPWGMYVGENRPNIRSAWRHIVRRFRRAGASNVRFELCLSPISSDRDQVENTTLESDEATRPVFWPGDNFVDIVAFDIYNRPPDGAHRWNWFDELLEPSYAAAIRWTDKPIWIQEMSTTGIGGDKAAWIVDAFNALRSRYPRVTSVTWFNHSSGGVDDWEFDSSPEARDALSRMVNPSTLPESRLRAPFAPSIPEALLSGIARAPGRGIHRGRRVQNLQATATDLTRAAPHTSVRPPHHETRPASARTCPRANRRWTWTYGTRPQPSPGGIPLGGH